MRGHVLFHTTKVALHRGARDNPMYIVSVLQMILKVPSRAKMTARTKGAFDYVIGAYLEMFIGIFFWTNKIAASACTIYTAVAADLDVLFQEFRCTDNNAPLIRTLGSNAVGAIMFAVELDPFGKFLRPFAYGIIGILGGAVTARYDRFEDLVVQRGIDGSVNVSSFTNCLGQVLAHQGAKLGQSSQMHFEAFLAKHMATAWGDGFTKDVKADGTNPFFRNGLDKLVFQPAHGVRLLISWILNLILFCAC